MSDNVTELNIEKQSENVISGKKVVAIVVIAAIVVSVLGLLLFHDQFNLDGLRRWSKYFTVKNDETFGQYSFDSISSNCYASFSDGLAVASIGGLNVYDKNGEERYILQQPIDLPRLLAGGKTAVAYDVGGHSLVALRDGEGEVLRLEETHPILDADLSDNGAICLSSSASGYKSVLSVYNEDQDLVYRWLSSSAYYPLCAISESGREIAAVSLGQNDGEFESSVCIFRTDSEEIEQKISLGGELVYDLVYLKEDHLCAVGQNSVQFISAKDERVVTYQYKDAYLKDFDFGGDGFLTLSTNMYRAGNRFSLMTVDEKGREIASCYLGKEILDLSAAGRYIAVLTQGKLTIYTQNLSVYHETTQTANATSVVMREDGTVLLLGGGRGTLYIP